MCRTWNQVSKLTTSTTTSWQKTQAVQVTVTRLDQADLSAAMVVTLTGGPGLTVPATVTIPAGLDKVHVLRRDHRQHASRWHSQFQHPCDRKSDCGG